MGVAVQFFRCYLPAQFSYVVAADADAYLVERPDNFNVGRAAIHDEQAADVRFEHVLIVLARSARHVFFLFIYTHAR